MTNSIDKRWNLAFYNEYFLAKMRTQMIGRRTQRNIWPKYINLTGIQHKPGTEIVSENNQEIPQSQTADKLMTPRGRATQQSRDTMKTN